MGHYGKHLEVLSDYPFTPYKIFPFCYFPIHTLFQKLLFIIRKEKEFPRSKQCNDT